MTSINNRRLSILGVGFVNNAETSGKVRSGGKRGGWSLLEQKKPAPSFPKYLKQTFANKTSEETLKNNFGIIDNLGT